MANTQFKEQRKAEREERRAIQKAEAALRREERKEAAAVRREERQARITQRRANRQIAASDIRSGRKPLFSENKIRHAIRANKDKAKAYLQDDEKMDTLLSGFEAKLKLIPRVGHRLADMPVMLAMLRSYVRREYTKVPLDTILLALAAVIYVVNPFDVVPDVLAGLGYLDDATAVGVVLNAIHSDVVDYKKWQAARKKTTPQTDDAADSINTDCEPSR